MRGEHAHKRIFDQVERQKLMTEESSMRLSAAKGRLDRSLNIAEQELQEAQQQILMLQVGIDHKNQTQSTPTDKLWLMGSCRGCRSQTMVTPLTSVFVLIAVSHLCRRFEGLPAIVRPPIAPSHLICSETFVMSL